MNPVQEPKDRDQIAQAYQSAPWWYDLRGFMILTLAYNSTIGAQLRFFGPRMGTDHLEVACGTGTLLEMVLRWRAREDFPQVRVVGVDYAPSMLEGAKRRFAGNENVQIMHADAARLPFEDASFDTACIANSIHCFPEIDAALADILRVLRPGGFLTANVLLYPSGLAPLRWIAQRINTWGIRKGILYSPFHADDIRQRFLAAGYEVALEFKSGNTWNVMARKPGPSVD